MWCKIEETTSAFADSPEFQSFSKRLSTCAKGPPLWTSLAFLESLSKPSRSCFCWDYRLLKWPESAPEAWILVSRLQCIVYIASNCIENICSTCKGLSGESMSCSRSDQSHSKSTSASAALCNKNVFVLCWASFEEISSCRKLWKFVLAVYIRLRSPYRFLNWSWLKLRQVAVANSPEGYPFEGHLRSVFW